MNPPQLKPFCISKHAVLEAWKRVKANRGAAGIDEESIEDFERKLKDNLYRLWNRMSSGSYLPPAVRTVKIPKAGGGERKLGIPTVADRVAQMVVSDGLKTNGTCRFENRVRVGGRKTPSEGCSDGGAGLDWLSCQVGLIWSLVR